MNCQPNEPILVDNKRGICYNRRKKEGAEHEAERGDPAGS
jgi:hypothetical protein